MSKTVVGLDIGHSAVKVMARWSGGEKFIMFPSVAIPAFRITDEKEAARARAETVTVANRDWFIGKTAVMQSLGEVAIGLRDDWIEMDEYAALFRGAIQKLIAEGVPGLNNTPLVVAGLPAAMHFQQKERLKAIMRKLHDAEYLVAPQPAGAYQTVMLRKDGADAPGRRMATESWAVVEVGYYTTDIMVMREGRWVEKGCDCAGGVRLAAEHLSRLLENQGIKADLMECEESLRTKQIKNYGKVLDTSNLAAQAIGEITAQIIDKSVRLIEPIARRLDGVIVAGGGAPLIIKDVQERWPHAAMLEDPRTAVADGFCRLGLAILIDRARRLVQQPAAA